MTRIEKLRGGTALHRLWRSPSDCWSRRRCTAPGPDVAVAAVGAVSVACSRRGAAAHRRAGRAPGLAAGHRLRRASLGPALVGRLRPAADARPAGACSPVALAARVGVRALAAALGSEVVAGAGRRAPAQDRLGHARRVHRAGDVVHAQDPRALQDAEHVRRGVPASSRSLGRSSVSWMKSLLETAASSG